MIEWLAQTPAILVSGLVIFAPGLLIAAAAGLRGLTLWAFAPVVSTAALTASALVLGIFGVGWRPLPALLATLGIAVLALLLRFAARLSTAPAPRPPLRPERYVLAAGIAAGIVLTASRVGLYMVEPDAISQTNDASFHLNALRYIVETGLASPLQLSGMIGAASFYPSGWHVIAGLVPQLTGASVEIAANAASLIIAAVVWPLGIALLTRSVGGAIAAATATALSAAVPAFPLLLIQWGILYPQLLAVAVLPASVAVVVLWSSLRSDSDHAAGRVARPALIVAIGGIAILVSQPSVVLPWAVASLAFGGFALSSRWRSLPTGRRVLTVAAVGIAALLALLIWGLFGRSVTGTWPPTTTEGLAIVEVLGNGYLGYPWAIGTSLLAAIGIVEAIRHARLRWLVATWLVFAGLYVVAASISNVLIRGLVVGPWYEDPYRLAALLPVVVLPLAGIGAAAIVRWFVSVAEARIAAAAWAALSVIVAVGVVSVVVSPQIARRDVFARTVDPNLYTVTADSFLSADELAVLERLDQSVPQDAVVIGNPSTGMSFGYALTGRNVIPRTWQPPPGMEYEVLWQSLRDVASDPAVCPALNAFGARYILDFGPGERYPGRWVMPGFDDLAQQPGFDLVDREGEASLWRVTACD